MNFVFQILLVGQLNIVITFNRDKKSCLSSLSTSFKCDNKTVIRGQSKEEGKTSALFTNKKGTFDKVT